MFLLNPVIFVVLGFALLIGVDARKDFSKNDLKGMWLHVDHKTARQQYLVMGFGDSSVWLSSHGDTVYSFRYELDKSTLIFKSSVDKRKAKVIALNQDSLVFKSFFENKAVQRYFRVNPDSVFKGN